MGQMVRERMPDHHTSYRDVYTVSRSTFITYNRAGATTSRSTIYWQDQGDDIVKVDVEQ